jgi:hypothetical protein
VALVPDQHTGLIRCENIGGNIDQRLEDVFAPQGPVEGGLGAIESLQLTRTPFGLLVPMDVLDRHRGLVTERPGQRDVGRSELARRAVIECHRAVHLLVDDQRHS